MLIAFALSYCKVMAQHSDLREDFSLLTPQTFKFLSL